jgi:flagellar motor component MotA
MFYLLGLAVFLFGVILGAMLLQSNLWNFMDLPSFILLIIPLAGVLTATQNWKIFGVGFKAAVLPKSNISEDMRGKAASLFRFLSKITVLVMVITVLVCWINILMGLDFADADIINVLGINIAASLITVFYGLILIAAVFEPIVIILKKRGEKERK